MAQVLKEEARIAIIQAAKQEFLEKGYKGASMRSIASKAHMTVGNLYRYYKNKEDINLSIVAPTFKEIDQALKSLTSNDVSMETRVFNLKPNVNQLRDKLDDFADKLVEIYFKHKTEFNILMLHSRLNEEMTEFFSELIKTMISESFVLEGLNKDRDTLSRAYAESLFEGLQVLFKNGDSDKGVLKVLIKTYLHSYVYMLDTDIRKFVQ